MLSDAIKSSGELYVNDDITERVASRGLVFEKKMTKTNALNSFYFSSNPESKLETP